MPVQTYSDGAGSTGEFSGTFWEKPTVNSFESGWEIYKPVIAAVNGFCLGYGLTLVTWCDFVIASDRAEFGYPEVRMGVPAVVGAIRLPQRINWQYAMEMLLTGDRIDAARAKEIGLAGWVVPHEQLMDEARALAGRLVAAAPLAARASKEVAMRSAALPPVEAIRFGETMRIVVAGTEDATEGLRAADRGPHAPLAGSLRGPSECEPERAQPPKLAIDTTGLLRRVPPIDP